MTKHIRSVVGAACALLVVLALAVVHPAAQQQAPYRPPVKRVSPADDFARQKSSLQTPRDADGHPDLTGLWNGGFVSPLGPASFLRYPGTAEPDQAVMQRGSQWNKPLYKPEYWDKVRSLDFGVADVDPAYSCGPPGVPRQSAPVKIVQKSNEIMLYNNSARFVPVDGRARDALDAEYSTFNGIPLGHWDGDTLVIESVGFNDISWLQWEGYFHTDRMKVIERLRREGDLLFYNYTVEDPDVLMEPWNSITYVRKLNTNKLARVDEAAPCMERDMHLLADPYYRG